MRFNAMFADLVGEASVRDISGEMLPEDARRTLEEGWMVDERGAWLLRRFFTYYFGPSEHFTDLTGYESAVNGRAINDLDLPDDGKARAVALARRGVAFARAALLRLNTEFPDHPPTTAYVSISDVDVEDEIPYEGSVTFVAEHDGEQPYVDDIDDLTTNAVLTIASSELRGPAGGIAG